MGGGLFQLVSYGTQDKYISGNPQITFFKSVYRRHTNFSIECIQQELNGETTTGNSEGIAKTLISKGNGDLLNKVYVSCDQTSAGVKGDKLIKQVELIIGGRTVDRHTDEWMQVWNELSIPESKSSGYKYMSGGYRNNLSTKENTDQSTIIVPLLFWFCRYPGLSLPLVALQYHDIEIKFTWNTNANINKDGSSGSNNCEVWADYIYLDTEERKRFSQSEHEYLIEQIQINDFSNKTTLSKYNLEFTHPVKELIWTEGNTGADAITNQKMNITLNGVDRMSLQNKEYYQLKQPFDHHTSIPGYNIKETDRPQLLANPTTLSALNLQALNADDNTPLSTSLDEDDDASIGVMDVLTDAAVLVESGIGLKTLTIRQATATTFKEGDLLHISIHSGQETGSVSNTNTRQYEVVSIKINTAETPGKTYTSLTLDRNIFLDAVVADDDDLEVRIVSRVQDPYSRCSSLEKNIYVYSFSLNPEDHQPSGTLNFSRIDSSKLVIEEVKKIDRVYAVNYNVLRISSGTANLVFTN
jgi:hypothetical protein